jgi:uncharacterized protein YjiS (DUF1127 family)
MPTDLLAGFNACPRVVPGRREGVHGLNRALHWLSWLQPRRHTRPRLLDLSDHLLADIGLLPDVHAVRGVRPTDHCRYF